MIEKELKKFNLNINDIKLYFNNFRSYLDSEFFDILVSFLNFSFKKNILGVLKIENDMYLLICNVINKEYAAIKINDDNISRSILYSVTICANNDEYIKHPESKIMDHGICDIENIVNNLFGNIRDVKLEERIKDDKICLQNYLLVYLPIDYIENDINYIMESNKYRFKAKYKVPLRLLDDNNVDHTNHLIKFYVPTIHPISKDSKNDLIIC